MALVQNDFLIRGCDGADAATFDYWDGGNDGIADFHTNLTNPLTDEGTYFRRFDISSGGASADYAISYLAINNTTDSGLWVNNLVNYAYSLRAWVRLEQKTQFTSVAASVGIFCGYSNFTAGTITTTEYGPRFMLGLQSPNTTTNNVPPFLNLVFDGDNSALADNKAYTLPTTNTAYAKNLGTQAYNTWYRIRLDVIPTVDYYLLRAYTGTGTTGNETWTLLEQRNIVPGTTGGTISNAHMGFYASCLSESSVLEINPCIDRFVALGEDLTS